VRLLLLLLLPACSFLEGRLATTSPPLIDMEEPLALHQVPDDEAERQKLPTGSFTGVHAGDARTSLQQMEEEPEGILVTRVVENSPADAAGLEEGDLLLEAGGRVLRWASEWRELELQTKPDSTLDVVYDRAGVERDAVIRTVARLRAPDRVEVERYREEDRTGIVVRTATEVESRAAGLGPGAGAVLVGMSRSSPLRQAGLRFGDLIIAAGDQDVAHPQVLLDAIRATEKRGTIELTYVRDGEKKTVATRVSRRGRETKLVRVPLLYSYEKDGDRTKISAFFWIYTYERTAAAYETTVLWLIKWRGGDADRIEQVKEAGQ